MKDKIIKTLKEIVAIDSFSSTDKENKVSEYIYNYISQLDYFKENPEFFGLYPIKDDYLNRKIAFAMVKGNSNDTVVLMNHYDVVGIEDYGPIKEYAFDIEKLPQKLNNIPINDEAKEDLASGKWIFGRGTADMKAGIAIHLAYIEEYSKNITGGNVLFISVADEESYSAGMRGAVSLLKSLKDRYNLKYELLIDSEPNRRNNNKQVLPIGTGGKTLPIVLVQGEKAHIAMCFDGINPIGILSEIFLNTELNLEFSDEYRGEVTMPPTWNYLKDFKKEYDVSIPLRAGGYFSVLSFSTTPDEILEKLKRISEDCFQKYINKTKHAYEQYKSKCKFDLTKIINYDVKVMYFSDLFNYCLKLNEDGFNEFYTNLYKSIAIKINNNELNYPQATLEIINSVLDFSKINVPIIIIGFAPPYYPAMSSRKIKGKEEKIEKYFNVIKNRSIEDFNVDVMLEEYTVALSDCSYCAVDKPFDFQKFSKNTPMWGDMYSIDFKLIEELNIPSMVFGPWGKDYHQITERVYYEDVVERVPALIKAVANYIFEKENN